MAALRRRQGARRGLHVTKQTKAPTLVYTTIHILEEILRTQEAVSPINVKEPKGGDDYTKVTYDNEQCLKLSTIPERENDEFIKSSVDDLVPIPRESELTLDSTYLECSMPIDPPLPCTDVLGDTIVDIDLLLGEHVDTLSTGNREIDYNPSRDIEELERLLADDPVPEFEDISSLDPLESTPIIDESTLLVTPLPNPMHICLREVERFDPFFSLTQSGETTIPYAREDHRACFQSSNHSVSDQAVVRLLDPKLKTLSGRGIECIFVGYLEHSTAFRFFVIKPNESVLINSIIESRDAIFDENRFSSVPRPSQRSLVNGTEDFGGSVVPEEVTEEGFRQKSEIDYFDTICSLALTVPKTADMSTPMGTSEKLMPNNGQAVSQLEYSRMISCLMYAMTCTRPDIAFAVGKLRKYNSNPDNPSTSGWVFMLGGGAISWAFKKQTCITGSTMEYEFVALAAAGKEAESLKNFSLRFHCGPNL
ncbi:hypothetical protein Tco_0729070 [Tanacetum coccineum]|uniref:Retroviral polymerase SH3-like domain-containing protein n=1 Tax=Tanacetum coccineum TaxID=301880 RepID=A0ABQ4YMW0_9ASTR